MAKYRSKPYEVEAVQWFKDGDHPDVRYSEYSKCLMLETVTGGYYIEPGYWVVRDGRHLYALHPETFATKFEPL